MLIYEDFKLELGYFEAVLVKQGLVEMGSLCHVTFRLEGRTR